VLSNWRTGGKDVSRETSLPPIRFSESQLVALWAVLKILEAASGFEPLNGGFAVHSSGIGNGH
jgi:hypothetical protein